MSQKKIGAAKEEDTEKKTDTFDRRSNTKNKVFEARFLRNI